MATIRRDGAPRISGTEVDFVTGGIPWRYEWAGAVSKRRVFFEAKIIPPVRRVPSAVPTRPSVNQITNTRTKLPEPAPSKNAVLRSRLPPAPGGISWPSRPAGWGSSSGADITPDQGFAIKSMSAMVKPRPGRPNIAANPTTDAVIEAVIRATVPTFAH